MREYSHKFNSVNSNEWFRQQQYREHLARKKLENENHSKKEEADSTLASSDETQK